MKKTNDRWSQAEEDLLSRYWTTTMGEIKLFQEFSALGTGRSFEAISRKLRRMQDKGCIKPRELAIKNLKVGYLDIETTNLAANFGIILTWYIKEQGVEKYHFGCVTKKELFDYQEDRRVVFDLLKTIQQFDILYTHYGGDRRFDVPFIRTRALHHGFQDEIPRPMEKFIFDTWVIAKNKLRLHSNRLDAIAEAVGITEIKKTPLSPAIWNLARYGHPKSLEYVLKHNREDVRLLEEVHNRLSCLERKTLKSI